jgi:hypothetical protein
MYKDEIYAIPGSQIGQHNAFLAQQMAKLAAGECPAQPKTAGVLDLIAGAHDALSGLHQTVAALEQRLGGVLRCSAPEPDGNGAGNALSSDAQAVESLRGLLTRISQTTAMVGSIHDRVQV